MSKNNSHGIPDGYEKSLANKHVDQKLNIVASNVKTKRKILPDLNGRFGKINFKLLSVFLVFVVAVSGVAYYILNRPVPRYSEDAIVAIKSSKVFNAKYNELIEKREKNESYVLTEQDNTELLGMPGEKPFYFYEEVAYFYRGKGNKEKAAEYFKLAKAAYDNSQKTSATYSAAKSAWYDVLASGEETKYEK